MLTTINRRKRQSQAIALIDRLIADSGSTLLLWQVACEFIAVLRRWQTQGRVSPSDVAAYCHEVRNYFQLVCPVPNVIPRSLQLTSQYSLSHWDSLLVAAALQAGVDCLYTEHLQAGAKYDTLTIINPFGCDLVGAPV